MLEMTESRSQASLPMTNEVQEGREEGREAR